MVESYTERYEHNQNESAKAEERLGELFFDWWGDLWCKRSPATSKQYSGQYSVEDLQKELKNRFPYHIIVDKLEKPLDPLKDCMTDEWTSYTWDNKLYAYFKTEEDKVKFILFTS